MPYHVAKARNSEDDDAIDTGFVLRWNAGEGLERMSNQFLKATFWENSVRDVKAIGGRTRVPNGMPRREKGVINHTRNVGERIGQQATQTPQSEDQNDGVVSRRSHTRKAAPASMKDVADKAGYGQSSKEDGGESKQQIGFIHRNFMGRVMHDTPFLGHLI